MEIHEEMASLRAVSGLSLRQLEESAGVDHSRITRIEHGKISPSHKDVVRIARGLSVSEEVRSRWLRDLEQKILSTG